jgi:outer membrane murein-binding lipoprotein Lpp
MKLSTQSKNSRTKKE